MARVEGKEVIVPNWADNAVQSGEKLLDLFDRLDDSIKKTSATSAKFAQKQSGQTAKSIKEVNQAYAEQSKRLKDSIAIDKEKARLTERLNKLQSKAGIEAEKLKVKIAQQRKETKQLAREELGLVDAYERLRKATNKAQLEFKQLASQYGVNSKQAQKAKIQFDKLDARLRRINNAAKDGRRDVGRYGMALNKAGSMIKGFGLTLAASFGVQQIASFFTSSIKGFQEQERAVTKVEQAIKSTGGAANRTSEDLQKMASELQKNTLFGDEQILNEVTAQLLTFTNIAGNQFDRTQKVALDLATVLDGDLQSASIQLGKALNDPIANLSALSRSGIQFSKDQKELIKSLAETGRLAEAQTLILDELERQYGGQAAAAAEANGGITQLSNSFGDFKEEVGKKLLEALKPTIKGLQDFFDNLSQEDIDKFANSIATAAEFVIAIGKNIGGLITKIHNLTTIFETSGEGADTYKNKMLDLVDITLSFVPFIGDLTDELRDQEEAFAHLTDAERDEIKVRGLANDQINKAILAYEGEEKSVNELTDAKKEELIARQKVLAIQTLQNELSRQQAIIDNLAEGELKQKRIQELKALEQLGMDRIDLIEKEAREIIGLEKEVEEERKNITFKSKAKGDKTKIDTLNDFKKQQDLLLKEYENRLILEGVEEELRTQLVAEKRIELARQTGQKIVELDFEDKSVLIDFENDYLKTVEQNATERLDIVSGTIETETELENNLHTQRLENNKKEAESLKQLASTSVEVFKQIAEAKKADIDEQIKNSEDEIKDREREIEDLRQQGTANAAASIAAEKKRIAQEKTEIDALQKKKRNLLLVTTGLERVAQLINSGNSSPFASAGADIASFISSLPTFIEGTEGTLGEALGNTNTVDGHILRADDREMILNPNKVNNLRNAGLRTTTDIETAAIKWQNRGIEQGFKSGQVAMYSDKNIVAKLDSVEKAIKNIEITQQHFDFKTAVETIKSKGTVTKNYHGRIKPKL